MDFTVRHLPDLFGMTVALFAHWQMAAWMLARHAASGKPDPRWRDAILVWRAAGMAWIFFGFGFGLPTPQRKLPYWEWLIWWRGMGVGYAFVIAGMWLIQSLTGKLGPAFNPGRRAALAAPAVILGYGSFIERNHFRLVEQKIRIAGLPKDLDGLKLVQLTDIHFSPYLDATDLNYAIDMANETKAHLALVTGDQISMRSDPLDKCLHLLKRLKADAGALGCLGNHEIVANCEAYTVEQGAKVGIEFLRTQARELRFGNASLNFVGVDYQRMGTRYLGGTESLIKPGIPNILLSHNPDVFPTAVQMGYDLTISGHTHGGQVTIEILNQYLNVARFFTPYVSGHYEQNGKSIYVSRGLGTVGIPARVGAPPEVSLIRLCAS